MEIQTSRLLGIIGALFMVIGILPSVGWLLMILGIVFVLIALNGYGDAYKDGSIIHNTVYTIVFEIIGVVVFIGVVIYGAMGFLASLGINNIMELRSWQAIDWQHAVNRVDTQLRRRRMRRDRMKSRSPWTSRCRRTFSGSMRFTTASPSCPSKSGKVWTTPTASASSTGLRR
jgi:hypothetical protein